VIRANDPVDRSDPDSDRDAEPDEHADALAGLARG